MVFQLFITPAPASRITKRDEQHRRCRMLLVLLLGAILTSNTLASASLEQGADTSPAIVGAACGVVCGIAVVVYVRYHGQRFEHDARLLREKGHLIGFHSNAAVARPVESRFPTLLDPPHRLLHRHHPPRSFHQAL
ncbi:Aste57867_18581 [Aphanomyces stellatus]|uniref:Aste57867_18581 protein n=1 Tax=Aphanomyces stellatus TaxID=120398 RepID=A0A485LBC0_9STRA|nr:hypothetical protein As57867_018519 [Aphanomyces stellatus]VFT95316.1 Aste57867_18581 [Aphanomyces stellatus]